MLDNYSVVILQEADHVPNNLACAALLVVLVLTLFLNSFVLLSVLGGPLRGSPHNAAVAVIACASLIDGFFNTTTSVVFHASWNELPHFYGADTVRVWCRSNAAALQITSVILTFGLAVLSYDRLAILRNGRVGDVPTRRSERLRTSLFWVLILSILASIILSLPVALGVLNTTLFEQRMSCSPAYASKQPEGVLIAVAVSAVYVTTWFFILRNGYLIARKILKERRRHIDLELVARQRAAERGSPHRGMITNLESWGGAIGESLHVYILTAFLITLFVLTVVPGVMTVQITQFYISYDVQQEFYVTNRNFSQNDFKSIRTDVFDSIFAWTRHGYNVFSPGLTLLIHCEIRKQCKLTFCCCCLVGNIYVQRQSRSLSDFVRDWKRKRRRKIAADYRTPVLFATASGLHLRTLREDRRGEKEPEFTIKFCDLVSDEVNSVRETPAGAESQQQTKLNETFVVKRGKTSGERELGVTFVKIPNGFEGSKISRNRIGSIELDLIRENGGSSSQRFGNRNS